MQEALIDSNTELNAMTPAYASILGLTVRKTDVGAQKIDGSALATYGMVINKLPGRGQDRKGPFFQETFLVADTSMEVVLGMPFLTLSNADVAFAEKELTWSPYTAAEALPTTKRMQIIDRKEFHVDD